MPIIIARASSKHVRVMLLFSPFSVMPEMDSFILVRANQSLVVKHNLHLGESRDSK